MEGVDATELHRLEGGADIGHSKTTVLRAALESHGVRL
jgi:hypothetical protein